jgi:hypothetical protein
MISSSLNGTNDSGTSDRTPVIVSGTIAKVRSGAVKSKYIKSIEMLKSASFLDSSQYAMKAKKNGSRANILSSD